MPQRIPRTVIQIFLRNHTLPIDISLLDPSSRTCPITHEEYGPRDHTYIYPDISPDGPDHPIQIKSCKHIFGRRALENSMQQDRPWAHLCPVCRVQLVPPARRTRSALLEDAVRMVARVASMLRFNDTVRDGMRRISEGQEVCEGEVEEMRRAAQLVTDGLVQVEQCLDNLIEVLVERRRI